MFVELKKKILTIGAAVLSVGFLATESQAATVTFGSLSSEASTGIIVDRVSGTQYTRADSFDTSVADVMSSIESDGAYQGWSIMNSSQADQFVASLLVSNNADCSTNGVVSGSRMRCGTVAGWTDGAFGASHTAENDYFAFLSEEAGRIGFIKVIPERVELALNWGSFATLDNHSLFNGRPAINLMLFRGDPVVQQSSLPPVPLPASGLMLVGALAGFGALRRRRKLA